MAGATHDAPPHQWVTGANSVGGAVAPILRSHGSYAEPKAKRVGACGDRRAQDEVNEDRLVRRKDRRQWCVLPGGWIAAVGKAHRRGDHSAGGRIRREHRTEVVVRLICASAALTRHVPQLVVVGARADTPGIERAAEGIDALPGDTGEMLGARVWHPTTFASQGPARPPRTVQAAPGALGSTA